MASVQESQAVDKKELLKEMAAFGLPYMMMSILGNSMNIINTLFMQRELSNVSAEMAQLYYSIVQTNCNKLTSIPQVLAIGFSTGIVPHLTTNLEQKDFRQLKINVLSALNTVCYIGLPLSFCLFALARPIYCLMYGSTYLDIGTEALMFSALLAVTGTISPITTSMMMSLRYRRRCLEFLAVGFAVKTVTFFLLIKWFGYTGAITSSALCGLSVIVMNLSYIKRKFNISFKGFYRNLIVIAIGLISMNGAFVLLRWIGLDGIGSSKIMAIVQLGIFGITGVFVYFMTTAFFQLPQRIFKMSLNKIARKLKRG
jgi:O-antigen/teichoic acid export membrane protein